jgi:D-3-phosphoglycerate dehydrogenase / 2-oxoglutarate reductase
MKILQIDPVHHSFFEELENTQVEVVDGREWNPDQILKSVHEFDGILLKSRIRIDGRFIDHALKLKFIARNGVGTEHIDLEKCSASNIVVFTAPEGSKDAVGEHAIGMLLSLMHKVSMADSQVRNSVWVREGNRGVEISGKTVSIIGYGNMGSAFAEKLSGFGCTVLAYDKYKSGFSDKTVTEAKMSQVFEETDILSLHVPLTMETNQMINTAYLDRFHKNIIIINTARGPVVNSTDLAAAIEKGKVTGACLDVIEYENASFEGFPGNNSNELPASWSYLINSNKTILTPHIAGWTFESDEKIARILGKRIRSFIETGNN